MSGRQRLLSLACLSLAGCFVACARDSGPAIPFETQVVGDTTWVVHRGLIEPTDTLHLDLLIGGLDERDGFVFGGVQEIEPTPDGGVLVYDYMAKQVYRFDRNGRYRRRIGRQGEGPGEYRSVMGLAVLSDGRILVRSFRAINVYSEDGDFIQSWPIRIDFSRSEMLTPDRNGGVAIKLPLSDLRNPYPLTYVGFLRLDGNGSVIDTVGKVVTPWDQEIRSPHSVHASQHVEWNPLGFPVSGVSSRLAFQIQRPDGQVVLSELPVPPVRFRSDKRAQWEEAMEELRKGAQMFASDIPEVPENKPVFHQLLTSSNGDVWISLSTPSEPDVMEAVRQSPGYPPWPLWKEPLLLAVFDSIGRFKKLVSGTSMAQARAVVGDTVWCIRTGDFHEEYVARYRVIPRASRD